MGRGGLCFVKLCPEGLGGGAVAELPSINTEAARNYGTPSWHGGGNPGQAGNAHKRCGIFGWRSYFREYGQV